MKKEPKYWMGKGYPASRLSFRNSCLSMRDSETDLSSVLVSQPFLASHYCVHLIFLPDAPSNIYRMTTYLREASSARECFSDDERN